MNSVITADTIDMAMMRNARKPCCQTPTTAAGHKARITSYMARPVVRRFRT